MVSDIPSQLLTQSLPFLGLSEAELQAVIQTAQRRCIKPNAFIFHQGDPALAFYILIQGEVKLTQVTPEGHQVLIRFIGPGEGFGIIAALSNANHPLSAQVVTDCLALVWNSEAMVRLMERFPRLALNALRMVSERHQELQKRYLELATERVERRVAHTVLRLARQAGQKAEGGVLIDLPLSRQDLAEMTGTTLYTVSRIVSRWEKQGFIKAGREWLLILSPHSLMIIAADLPPDASPKPAK